jgi:hypothetical protein
LAVRFESHPDVAKVLPGAVGRGDKQGLLALSAEHIKWIEDSGFRDDVHAVFGLVAAEPAQGS